ncbi:MAG TPA: hypothetical protein VFJ16_01345 [Longimicrobium sp.]|nr:hypothetical protein [Longimicrobium sp.]
MKRRSDKDIGALFRDGSAVDRAVALAAQDAVRLHRRHNVPLVSWADGRVVHVDPWTVPLPEDESAREDGPRTGA